MRSLFKLQISSSKFQVPNLKSQTPNRRYPISSESQIVNPKFPNRALIVFAKAPVAGQVKTRLSPPLSQEDAARLYEAFLGDALEAYAADDAFGLEESVALRLYLAGAESPRSTAGFAPGSITTHRQKGEGLGPRMLRAFVETFAAGFERIVIIGTDHPTLPSAFVGEAFRALSEPFTVAIGPSTDGGYYLLGLNELYAPLFEMEYSHGSVFEETLERTIKEGAHPVVLPEWYDVDDMGSLQRLVREWRDGTPIPQRTESVLRYLLEAYPIWF